MVLPLLPRSFSRCEREYLVMEMQWNHFIYNTFDSIRLQRDSSCSVFNFHEECHESRVAQSPILRSYFQVMKVSAGHDNCGSQREKPARQAERVLHQVDAEGCKVGETAKHVVYSLEHSTAIANSLSCHVDLLRNVSRDLHQRELSG